MDNIISLATAVIIAVSYHTSHSHVTRYKEHMLNYLKGLQTMEYKLVPNHHLAMHLGEFLLRFGPAHCWWTFPYERLIGVLGEINTNDRIGTSYNLLMTAKLVTELCASGEMELTMSNSFTASAKLHAILQSHPDIDKTLEPLQQVVQQFSESSSMAGYFTQRVQSKVLKGVRELLVSSIVHAVRALGGSFTTFRDDSYVQVYRSCHYQDVTYSCHLAHSGNSLIMFGPAADPCNGYGVPAVIDTIFSMEKTDDFSCLLFAIRPFTACPSQTNPQLNPFLRYPDFRASLWSSAPSKEIVVIYAHQIISHAIGRRWSDGVSVFRSLTRVSLFVTWRCIPFITEFPGLPYLNAESRRHHPVIIMTCQVCDRYI